MLIGYKRGQGSIVLRVKIRNSSVSTGAGLTGLTSASSGLIISTIADNEASATAYTVGGSTIETITTLGTYAAPTATKCRFKEVDATNHKGIYEIQLADARYAVSSAKSLLVSISGATNAAECDVVIPLRDLDPYDSVRAGLTALPNANAEAAGGLYTRGTGAGQLSQTANGELGVTTLTKTLTTYTGNTVQTGDAYARLGAPAGASVSADVAAVKTDTGNIYSAVDTEVAAILAAVDTEVASILSALTSNRGEPGQGAPAVSTDAFTKLDYLYKAFRNKVTQDATTLKIYADDAVTVDQKATVSDDGTTFTRGELATGP